MLIRSKARGSLTRFTTRQGKGGPVVRSHNKLYPQFADIFNVRLSRHMNFKPLRHKRIETKPLPDCFHDFVWSRKEFYAVASFVWSLTQPHVIINELCSQRSLARIVELCFKALLPHDAPTQRRLFGFTSNYIMCIFKRLTNLHRILVASLLSRIQSLQFSKYWHDFENIFFL